LADAYLDILRALGFGPVAKWVDDKFLVRIRREYLDAYNQWRSGVRDRIERLGGKHHKGARIWWEGGFLADNSVEEFVEDFTFPLVDHSVDSARSERDREFTYMLQDIEQVSEQLGVIFALEKKIDFATSAPFTGLDFDLGSTRTVSLPEKKREKYATALSSFLRDYPPQSQTPLSEVQSIYGKLLYAAVVVPEGRAYLTSLEALQRGFEAPGANAFSKHTVTAELHEDLTWWTTLLSRPLTPRPLPVPTTVLDPGAYSDASSGVGVGVVIGNRWRAWRFHPGWKSQGRDIGWAEAVGFELLCRLVLLGGARNQHILVYGDNKGVVEGWSNFRSRSRHTNRIFRRIHQLLNGTGVSIHARYVRSAANPADGPSRGVYDIQQPVLPRLELDEELRKWLVDWDYVGDQAVPWTNAEPKPTIDPDREHKRRREDAFDADTAVSLAVFKDAFRED
jgi:hypothetical protein